MNDLGKTVVYLLAMGWAGTEVILLAAGGMWPLLVVAFLLFAVAFIVVGCYPLDEAAINQGAKVFFVIVAVCCLVFAIGTWGRPLLFTAKAAGAIFLCAYVFRLPGGDPGESHEH